MNEEQFEELKTKLNAQTAALWECRDYLRALADANASRGISAPAKVSHGNGAFDEKAEYSFAVLTDTPNRWKGGKNGAFYFASISSSGEKLVGSLGIGDGLLNGKPAPQKFSRVVARGNGRIETNENGKARFLFFVREIISIAPPKDEYVPAPADEEDVPF